MFLMLSCGSSLRPEQLSVYVPEHYQGPVHIDACVPNAPAKEITVSTSGAGATSLCPANNRGVELQIIEKERQYKVAVNEVRIGRTGDGLATSIEAQLK
jgi:hypothetical protein